MQASTRRAEVIYENARARREGVERNGTTRNDSFAQRTVTLYRGKKSPPCRRLRTTPWKSRRKTGRGGRLYAQVRRTSKVYRVDS